MNHMGSLFQLGRVRARACARYGVLVVGEEMKGLVNCNFLPGSAPDGLSLAQFHPSPCRARTGRKNSGRSAKRLACRARVLLAKVPIALKRAVGLSGPSSSRQSAPILQQWSEQAGKFHLRSRARARVRALWGLSGRRGNEGIGKL